MYVVSGGCGIEIFDVYLGTNACVELGCGSKMFGECLASDFRHSDIIAIDERF